MNKQRISRGFDFMAPFYEGLGRVFVGPQLFESQKWELPFLPPASRVLIVGGGAGSYLKELIATGRVEYVCYVDISAKMIELSKKKIQMLIRDAGPLDCSIDFIEGTVDDIPENERFDVIVTNFFLDLFTAGETKDLVIKMDHHLRPGGLWFFADFYLKDDSGRGGFKEFFILSLYAAFELVCGISGKQLPPYDSIFNSLDYSETKQKFFMRDMIRSVIYKKHSLMPAS